jgi:hypothetical protein
VRIHRATVAHVRPQRAIAGNAYRASSDEGANYYKRGDEFGLLHSKR